VTWCDSVDVIFGFRLDVVLTLTLGAEVAQVDMRPCAFDVRDRSPGARRATMGKKSRRRKARAKRKANHGKRPNA
jgi:hypothetical protein